MTGEDVKKFTEQEEALRKRGLCGRKFSRNGKDWYCLLTPHGYDPEHHADSDVLRLPAKDRAR